MIKPENFKDVMGFKFVVSGFSFLILLCLIQIIIYFEGQTQLTYPLYLSVFFAGQGMAFFIFKRKEYTIKKMYYSIVTYSVVLCLIANPGVLLFYWGEEFLLSFVRDGDLDLHYILLPCTVLLTFLLGVFSEVELPIYANMHFEEKDVKIKQLNILLASKAIAICLASIIFVFFLFPIKGVYTTIQLASCFFIVMTLVMAVRTESYSGRVEGHILKAITVYCFLSLIFL
ncbi:MAG: hypothetical protein ACI9QD_000945 [Thermoproteota archaeon]|jgi:hypothetical protein